ncbi:Uncharacterised protein [Eikenella corrodens]|uniref:Uncharacterized protein n=2 Tax=Eikenella corrodens TaxID=539 RepID=C0DRV4_EIKCO|nr:hypothetical protein [Eikenella corrodens]EEG25251.1 hypothetical protein EIKCOROL_00070 [Eikenella corrodens ATCC 23834]UAK74249.1 hypothetical protein K8P00_06805 [Eikenella corrodens]SNW10381.1 Uncharacterised protein [Eikenella corrodens]
MTALTQLLLQAFPAAYQAEAGQLLAHMQHPRSPSPSTEPDKLLLGGQTIRLIRRQYGLAIARRPESLNPIQHAMFHCLHTRHHDGHVREQHFAALLAPDQPAFVAPFAAQLLGEYVLPIQEQVCTFFRHNRAILAAFLAENPAYWRKQQNRIRSYWHCYHRHQYPDWPSYPINRLAQEIDAEVKRHHRSFSGSLS